MTDARASSATPADEQTSFAKEWERQQSEAVAEREPAGDFFAGEPALVLPERWWRPDGRRTPSPRAVARLAVAVAAVFTCAVLAAGPMRGHVSAGPHRSQAPTPSEAAVGP